MTSKNGTELTKLCKQIKEINKDVYAPGQNFITIVNIVSYLIVPFNNSKIFK